MFGFLRGRGGRLNYETPRGELPRQLTADAEAIEQRVRNLDRAMEEARQDGNQKAIDRFLDARNAIRPPRPDEVPVNPGRPS